MAQNAQSELFGVDEMLPLFKAAADREATNKDDEDEPDSEPPAN